jgi:hypothetical protein
LQAQERSREVPKFSAPENLYTLLQTRSKQVSVIG